MRMMDMTGYLTKAEFWLLTTTLIYFLMNGAQIFETAVFVPKWTAAPPDSLKLLADPNGTSLKAFWIILHSVHEITFIIAIVACWKLDPIRNWLLLLFLAHMAVRVWTLAYFAPTIIDLQRIAETQEFTQDLAERVHLWVKLNYLRVSLFVLASMGTALLCVRLFGLKGR